MESVETKEHDPEQKDVWENYYRKWWILNSAILRFLFSSAYPKCREDLMGIIGSLGLVLVWGISRLDGRFGLRVFSGYFLVFRHFENNGQQQLNPWTQRKNRYAKSLLYDLHHPTHHKDLE